MTAPHSDAQMAALTAWLAWFREVGADAAVGDATIDWLQRGDARPGADFEVPAVAAAQVQPAPAGPSRHGVAQGAVAPRVNAPTPQALPERRSAPIAPPRLVPQAPLRAVLPPDDAMLAAREAARTAASIEDLERILAGFDGCGLKKTAKSLCFYRGAAPARVMVIGEAPGADEDKIGKPFVGPAGQLLDRMLAPIGLDERTVHITNTVYWRPPGNRTPTPQETLVCRPFLERQVELVKPDIILLLGGAAANQILNVPEGIMRLRGKWHDVTLGSHTARAMATLHPAYLLRTPVSKRQAWRDLLAVETALSKRDT